MFTYSHANTPLGQSERAYYLSYFMNLDIFAGLIGLICRFFCAIASLLIASRIKTCQQSSGDRSDFDLTIDLRGRYWI